MPGARALLTVVLNIGGPKKATVHLDFRQFETAGNIDADFTPTQLQELAQAAYDGWSGSPDLSQWWPAGMSFDHAEAFSYTIGAHTPTSTAPCLFERVLEDGPESSTGDPQPGTNAGTSPPPPNVAWVTSFRASSGGRRGRGRVFWPQVPQEDLIGSDGLTDASTAADFLASVNDWIDGIVNSESVLDQSLEHAIFSCMDGTTRPVIARTQGTRVDTQRRRLRRVS